MPAEYHTITIYPYPLTNLKVKVSDSSVYMEVVDNGTNYTAELADGLSYIISADGYKSQTIPAGNQTITLIPNTPDISKLSNGTDTYNIRDDVAREAIDNLASVATSGSYNDLSNKPTIPTINNPTITFTQGGTTKGTITLNQSSNQTIAFDAGGGGSSYTAGDYIDITNNVISGKVSTNSNLVVQPASQNTYYAWYSSYEDVYVYTLSSTPSVGDVVYLYSNNSMITFTEVTYVGNNTIETSEALRSCARDSSKDMIYPSAGPSDEYAPSQKAVKTYVDNIVGDIETALHTINSGGSGVNLSWYGNGNPYRYGIYINSELVLSESDGTLPATETLIGTYNTGSEVNISLTYEAPFPKGVTGYKLYVNEVNVATATSSSSTINYTFTLSEDTVMRLEEV